MSDFLKRYARALGIEWKGPPSEASRRARRRPSGDPVAPPPERAPVRNLRPSDIRSSSTAEAPGGMISRTLPGLDVTLMVTEPEGDGLWEVEGRAWRNPRTDDLVEVVLVQNANVLARVEIRNGGHFRFEEILVGEWTLEFHLGSSEVVILRGPVT